MPRKRLQVVNLSDFTGGLNLRADAFQLGSNESPDMMNVDVDPRGGFRQRKPVAPFGTGTLAASPHSLFVYENSVGTRQVLAALDNGAVHSSTGGAWTSRFTFATVLAKVRSATFKDNLYATNGTDAAVRWDGTTATALGTAFNDNLTVPTGGNMPKAKCVAVWQGSVWVANTTEGGTAFPNRLRWSHPNFPEDYRTVDFIDVDTGVDGDEITALVPFGDRLIVFKRKSTHAIYGHGPDAFSVLPISHTYGAISQESVVNTDMGVFFVSWPDGVMRYDGRRVDWLFERLFPSITNGAIQDAQQGQITVGWVNRRLWVSVPYQTTTNSRTFVFDPAVGKQGAWVQYDLGLGPMTEWRPPSADAQFLATSVGRNLAVRLDQDGAADDFGAGLVHINSWYRTRWLDFGQAAVRKRWRRPEIVLMGGTTASLLVQAMADYDASVVRHTFDLSTLADPNVFAWDDAAHGWDSGAFWARDSVDVNALLRGSAMGTARAISLKFNGPTTNAAWGVDSISLKFSLKPVRS